MAVLNGRNRPGISRKALYRVEQRDPAASLGIYAGVLQVLRLPQYLISAGADDDLGRLSGSAQPGEKRFQCAMGGEPGDDGS
jgi:hypothetical protein